MKTFKARRTYTEYIFILAVGFACASCHRQGGPPPAADLTSVSSFSPVTLVLTTHEGREDLDIKIRDRQERIRGGLDSVADFERLGWLFVAKARASYDAGFYKLAEQCALVMDGLQPRSAEALLLRGHVLHSQHRFKDAEALAQQLVMERGLAFDHGLLGDILVDLGRVDEAARAYQSMLDLKPDPQGYARAAHIRWLKGDIEGAVELMRMAVRGVSPRDAESAAWICTQFARYLWQSQLNEEAASALDMALGLQSNCAPALLLRGRMFLSEGQNEEAISALHAAAQINPLPEYLWVWSEALRADGRETEAMRVEKQLTRAGVGSDPRTCALFLASHAGQREGALALARAELADRQDIFTHDALAWALAAGGHFAEARAPMGRALALGTPDARLYFHAVVIAAGAGHYNEARHWLEKVKGLTPQLLPSEKKQLATTAALIGSPRTGASAPLPSTEDFLPLGKNESMAARN